MKQMVEFLARHGYWVLFVSVLGRQACLPVPANLLLLAAGALAGLGRLNLAGIITFAVAAFLLADTAWYAAGTRWGSRTLEFVCGAAADPVCLRRQDSRQIESSRGEIAAGFEVHHRSGCRRCSDGGNLTNRPTSFLAL